jgi:hypothetical protein
VGIATFRDQAIGRFPRQSVRSLLASLATTLDVPVVCRLPQLYYYLGAK